MNETPNPPSEKKTSRPAKFRVMREWGDKLPHPTEIPWEIIEPHREQAAKNHGHQTLERLNERGGLALVELWHVVNDQDWAGAGRCGARVTLEEARAWLNALLGQCAAGKDVNVGN